MNTKSTLVKSWSDPDYNNGEWPFPTRYEQYLIEGPLADRVRKRLGEEGKVYLTEEVVSGGWSEFTQETDYNHSIQLGDFNVKIEGSYYDSSIEKLVKWLGEDPDEDPRLARLAELVEDLEDYELRGEAIQIVRELRGQA